MEGEIYNLEIIFNDASAVANLPLSIIVHGRDAEALLKRSLSVIADTKERGQCDGV